MRVSTTGKDIFKWVLIVIAIIAAGIIIINLVKQKNKRAKEKAEEDQKILNTPIHDIADDDLENKYL
jgi:bacteriorhodopsin